MKYTPIEHQFTLFHYNELRLRTKVPIKRISRQRMEQAMKEMRGGKPRSMLQILRRLNDDLTNYEKRIKV